MRICTSQSLDVFTNLAVEDYLMSEAPDAPPTLLCWRAKPSVVIGKHQNPWRECRLREMERAGVALARRISGGGAVYHDEGNLNYAYFCRRDTYRQDAVFDVVLEALGDLGISAHRMGKSSLGVDGRKFSGNAFCYRRDAVLHHGTLLVGADLDALNGMLKGRDEHYDTHAVASEPAPVTNLTDHRTDLTPDMIIDVLANRFAAHTGERPSRFALDLAQAAIVDRADEMRGTAWCYDRTPRFRLLLETAPESGSVQLELSVRNVLVEDMTFSAPEAVAAWLHGVRSTVEGRRLGDETVTQEVRAAIDGSNYAVGNWLVEKLSELAPVAVS